MKNTTNISNIPPNDKERVAALHHYRILDSPAEAVFDNILALACQMFNTPAGLISLVDKDRVFFKSNYKNGFTYPEREKNICSFVVQEEDIVVIEDATNDPRTQSNPAVVGAAHIRFYAGAPLKTKDGYVLGTLCVVDLQPRSFDAPSWELLKNLAKLVMDQIEFRLEDIEKEEKKHTIQRLNGELKMANVRLTETIGQLEKAQQVQNSLLEQVRFSETRLLQAMKSGNMGTWSIDATTNAVRLSALSKEILGFKDDAEISIQEISKVITEDYRPQVKNILQNALELLRDIDISFTISHLSNGQRRWVRITGKSFSNSQGKQLSYSGMLMDISEHKQDEERKNDFIGMVSHELKTPLTSLSGYLQILQMKTLKSEDNFATSLLQKANKQIGKMTTMINGFLNLSRLESGKIQIDKTYFDIADLVKEVEEDTYATISSHQVLFAPVEATFVLADRDKIGHVINNLLSNAVKYSSRGSTIQVACITVNGYAQLSVKDNGIGIQSEDIPKLFERYYRVGGDVSISGFGIGLYLCKEIIDRHNGNIWVESEPSKGSTFSFTLPISSKAL